MQVFANSEGARTTPSVVAFTDSERLIGQPAQAQAAGNAANTIFDAKRLIGRSIKDTIVSNDCKSLCINDRGLSAGKRGGRAGGGRGLRG